MPQHQPYVDFSLRVEQNGLVRADSPEGERRGTITLDVPKELYLSLRLIEKNETDEEFLREFGAKLYRALFSEAIERHLTQTEAVARAQRRQVRIRLSCEPQELARLPWEFLYRSEGSYFLAVNPDTVLSRYLDLPLPPQYVRKHAGPLHLLLILSMPADQSEVDTDNWRVMLEEALATPLSQGQLTLQVVSLATAKNIRLALLQQEPDIVQFVGHGSYQGGKGYVALIEDEQALTTRWLDDEDFASFFLGHNRLGLVSLATCESARSDTPQAFQGLAPRLVQRGLPAVIAMQYRIRVRSAHQFLESLYQSIAARRPLDWAVQHARNTLAADQGRDIREFATPVLYMRALDGEIFPD